MNRRGRALVLRMAVIAIGALMILFGLLLQFRPDLAAVIGGSLMAPLRQPGAGPILLGLALLLSGLFQGRYGSFRAPRRLETDGWEKTGEIFRDEDSGEWLQVWFNPASGERRYLPAEPAP